MQSNNRKVLRVHYLPTDLKLRLDVDLQANPTIGSLKPLILNRISQKNPSVSQNSPDKLTILDEDSFELDNAQLTQSIDEKSPLRVRDTQINLPIHLNQQPLVPHPSIPTIVQPASRPANNAQFFAQLSQAQSSNAASKVDEGGSNNTITPTNIFSANENINYTEPIKTVFMLNYRMLNLGFNTTTVYTVKIGTRREDTMLSHLKEQIFRKHGISNDKFNCAFYDQNGLPLTRTVATLPITDATIIGGLEQVPAEDLKECQSPLPRLAYVNIIPAHIDVTCYSKLPHDDSVNCNTQIFIMYNSKSNVIRINLDEDTIKILKQRVYSKTNVPTDKQSLNYGGKLLVDENNLVQLYGVGVNSNITLNIIPSRNETGWGYSSNFSSTNLETATKQTLRGIRQFRSSMYVLSGRLNENQKKRFLAVLRELSDNNAPMISAVYRLFKKTTLFYTEKIAIQQGMLSLFRKIFQSSKELAINVLQKAPQRIFEYSRACLSQIVKTAKEPTQMPERWADVENFTFNDFSCSISTKQITDIVGLKLDSGKIVYCDRVAVFQKIQSKQKVNGIEKTPIQQSAMVQLPMIKFLLQLYKQIKTGEESTSGLNIWQPKVPFMPEKADQGVRKFSLPQNEKDVNQIAEKDSNLKILSALDLKGHPEQPSLTRNQNGLLVVYTGRNKNVNKPIDLFDVMKGESSNASADDLAQAIIQGGDDQIKDEVLIKRTPKEAIVVLFDTSSSMNMKFLDTEITRIAIVKQFFQAFAERTMAYDFHHVISLIVFNHIVTVQCQFTQIFNSFIKHVQKSRANGLTHLYDALYQAGEMLNTLANSYPGVLKRVICLSDGEDVGSLRKSQAVAKFLQDSNITIDSFIVGPNCDTLVGITHATGGHSFAPASLDEGIRLFEWETVLRAGVREQKTQPIKPVNTDQDLESLSNLGYHKKPTNIQQPQKLKSDVAQPSKVLRVARQNVPDMAKLSKAAVMRVKRVLRETNSLNTTPHPAFQFFPCQDEICFWRVLMRGPEETPYQGGVFELYIQFPKEYPQKPPEMRFITPIYHCNINANGRICHSIFDRNYTVDTTVRMIFDCLYGLLMTPDPQDPLDNAIAQEYYTNLQGYRTKARDMTLKQASKSMLEMETQILKGKNKEESSLYGQQHPDHFLDPLTHELMDDPVMVKASGKVYDRKIVTLHIQKHGKDPITQQQASISDLVPVDSLLKAIEDYKKSVMNQKAWYLQ